MYPVLSCVLTLLQGAGSDPAVAPFICGAVVADGPLFPGETFRGTMHVDTDICKEGAVFSIVAMLSESLSMGILWYKSRKNWKYIVYISCSTFRQCVY